MKVFDKQTLRRCLGIPYCSNKFIRKNMSFAKRFSELREMGGAPRNPAPRNHFLVWIVKPSGCNCTDAPGGKTYRRVPTPLSSTSPFSDEWMQCPGSARPHGEVLQERVPERLRRLGQALGEARGQLGVGRGLGTSGTNTFCSCCCLWF